MRGFGIVILIVGVLAIIGSMAMDVSVPTGTGRVNNIGLMAERQNFIIIGGLMLLVGLIMAIVGGKRSTVPLDRSDNRACPLCAETIKNAAIRCKHCGADVPSADHGKCEPGDNPPIAHAWSKKDTEDSYAGYWILSAVTIGLIIFTIFSRL